MVRVGQSRGLGRAGHVIVAYLSQTEKGKKVNVVASIYTQKNVCFQFSRRQKTILF